MATFEFWSAHEPGVAPKLASPETSAQLTVSLSTTVYGAATSVDVQLSPVITVSNAPGLRFSHAAASSRAAPVIAAHWSASFATQVPELYLHFAFDQSPSGLSVYSPAALHLFSASRRSSAVAEKQSQ